MPELMQFKLTLRKSHIKYKLLPLSHHRRHFPPSGVKFEASCGSGAFVTYIDNMNRLRLTEFLKLNPSARPGDFIIFRRDPMTGMWDIRLRKSERQTQLAPVREEKVTRRSGPRDLTHEVIQESIVKLAEYYNMTAESEYRGEIGVYDVVWRRVLTGNPVKVFEVQHRGSLDSAFVKLKHAYDVWNARLFLITTSAADNRKAHQLLAGSFHEMRDYTLIVNGWDVLDWSSAKERFRKLDIALKR